MISPRTRGGNATLALLVLIGLPLFLLCANDEWIFDSTHFFDTNVYIGFFRHYLEFKLPFVANYKSSRLPFVLPGVLAYRWFPPVAAHHLLFLSFRSVETVLLFAMVKKHYGAQVAFVVAAIGAVFTSPHPLTSYHIQTTSTYLIAALAVIDLPERWRLDVRAFLAGFFFALGTTTDTVLIAFVPMLGIYLLAAERQPYRAGRLALLVLASVVGAAASLAVVGVLNVALGGPFLFFVDQLNYSLHIAKGQAISGVPLPTFLTQAWSFPWLVLPLIATVGSLVVLGAGVRRRRWGGRPALDAACFLASALVSILMEHKGLGVLEYPHLYHPFYVPMFLALPALLTGARRRFDAVADPLFIAIVTLAAVAPLALFGAAVSRLLERTAPTWPTTVNGVPFAFAAAALALAVGVLGRRRPRLVLVAGALGLSVVNAFCVTPWQPAYVYQLGYDCPFRREAFETVIAGDEAISEFDPNNEARWASPGGLIEYPAFDGKGWCKQIPVQTVAREVLLTHYFYTSADFIYGVKTPALNKVVIAGTSPAEMAALEAGMMTGVPAGATLTRKLDRQFVRSTFSVYLRGYDVTLPK